MTEKEMQKSDKIHAVFLALYFFIPYHGCKTAIEYYLKTDRLGLIYFFLSGLVGLLCVLIYFVFLRQKATAMKVFGVAVLLIAMIIINNI